MNATYVSRKLYGGRSPEQRTAERRRALISSGLSLWQRHGWPGVTMRGVCAMAGLTDRYFYESFADRDDLLANIWDQMRDEAVALILGAIAREPEAHPLDQLGDAIAAVVHDIAEEPVRAQVLFGDHAGSPVLEQRRRDAIKQVTDMLIELGQPYVREGIDPVQFRMSTILGIGGFVELIHAWRSGLFDVTADAIIEHLQRVGAALAATFLDPRFAREP